MGIGSRKIVQKKIASKRKRILEYIIDETAIKFGSELIWLWIAIEPKNIEILALNISNERNMFIVERFLSGVVKDYGKYPVSTDWGYMVPSSLSTPEVKTSYPFTSIEKFGRDDDTIH